MAKSGGKEGSLQSLPTAVEYPILPSTSPLSYRTHQLNDSVVSASARPKQISKNKANISKHRVCPVTCTPPRIRVTIKHGWCNVPPDPPPPSPCGFEPQKDPLEDLERAVALALATPPGSSRKRASAARRRALHVPSPSPPPAQDVLAESCSGDESDLAGTWTEDDEFYHHGGIRKQKTCSK